MTAKEGQEGSATVLDRKGKFRIFEEVAGEDDVGSGVGSRLRLTFTRSSHAGWRPGPGAQRDAQERNWQ